MMKSERLKPKRLKRGDTVAVVSLLTAIRNAAPPQSSTPRKIRTTSCRRPERSG